MGPTHTGIYAGRSVEGWIISVHGVPAHFQIAGSGGLCVSIDAISGLSDLEA